MVVQAVSISQHVKFKTVGWRTRYLVANPVHIIQISSQPYAVSKLFLVVLAIKNLTVTSHLPAVKSGKMADIDRCMVALIIDNKAGR